MLVDLTLPKLGGATAKSSRARGMQQLHDCQDMLARAVHVAAGAKHAGVTVKLGAGDASCMTLLNSTFTTVLQQMLVLVMLPVMLPVMLVMLPVMLVMPVLVVLPSTDSTLHTDTLHKITTSIVCIAAQRLLLHVLSRRQGPAQQRQACMHCSIGRRMGRPGRRWAAAPAAFPVTADERGAAHTAQTSGSPRLGLAAHSKHKRFAAYDDPRYYTQYFAKRNLAALQTAQEHAQPAPAGRLRLTKS